MKITDSFADAPIQSHQQSQHYWPHHVTTNGAAKQSTTAKYNIVNKVKAVSPRVSQLWTLMIL
jgi:hypothetical protein